MIVSLNVFTTLDISPVETLQSLLRWACERTDCIHLRPIYDGTLGAFFAPNVDELPSEFADEWHEGAVSCEIPDIGAKVSIRWNYKLDRNTPYWPNWFILEFDLSSNKWTIARMEDFLFDGVSRMDGFFGCLLTPDVTLWAGPPWGLMGGFQQIPHLSVFGEPYINLLGRKKILTAPVFAIKEQGPLIGFRLFEGFPDAGSEQWTKLQNKLHTHFGPEFFCKRASVNQSISFSIFNIQRVLRMLFEFARERRRPVNLIGGPVRFPNVNWEQMKSR